jgi:hypothetical protein
MSKELPQPLGLNNGLQYQGNEFKTHLALLNQRTSYFIWTGQNSWTQYNSITRLPSIVISKTIDDTYINWKIILMDENAYRLRNQLLKSNTKFPLENWEVLDSISLRTIGQVKLSICPQGICDCDMRGEKFGGSTMRIYDKPNKNGINCDIYGPVSNKSIDGGDIKCSKGNCNDFLKINSTCKPSCQYNDNGIKPVELKCTPSSMRSVVGRCQNKSDPSPPKPTPKPPPKPTPKPTPSHKSKRLSKTAFIILLSLLGIISLIVIVFLIILFVKHH